MRLEKIKLAGFKSFVDPTTVHMPSNLVGIVGPNGCGKSNIIDAARWVMGESSAKMLRGESMADVIFNGSSSRKPVGTASIELLFDNSDGGAGGQYAQYGQISVKRQVFRDGQSSYFLNGVRCRRRDITDLFLGTGLGPRSYSIIEQGMISRLIEARPEELRAFLEEAAGISKYKERRRETENRIRHTRDNLDRLNDLLEEVEKQLLHLKRQAKTAEKYKELKEKERQLKAELLALRWRSLEQELAERDRALAERETAMEAAVAGQRSLESDIERSREQHTDANENFNKIQGRFYAVGSEIARLEQSIKHTKELREQQQLDLEQTEKSWQEALQHKQQDGARLQELNTQLGAEEPKLAAAREEEKVAAERLAEQEQAMHAWQTEWEEFNRQAAEPAQTAQVERTRINHLEQQERNHQERLRRLSEELERLQEPQLQQEITQLQEKEQDNQGRVTRLQEQLSQVAEQIVTIRDNNTRLRNEQDEIRVQLQTIKGRHASLEALQEAALGKDDSAVSGWLEQQQLGQAARLAERIEVDSGWQTAVETVLGFHLQAVCTGNLDSLAATMSGLGEGAIALFDTESNSGQGDNSPHLLLGKVQAPWALDSLLAGVHAADGLPEALQMRSRLQAHESVVTRDGVWMGRNWLRISRAAEQNQGVLEREQEIRDLGGQQQELERKAAELETTIQQGRERLQQVENTREQVQRQVNEANRDLSEIRSGLSGRRARAEHLKNRDDTIRGEVEELHRQQQQEEQGLKQARSSLHAALHEMETLGERREKLIDRRDSQRLQLDQAREEAQKQRNLVHEIALKTESMRSSQQSLTESLQRMEGQLSHLTVRRDELTTSLQTAVQPLAEWGNDLEGQLQLRVEVEEEMKAARRSLEEIEATLRKLDQQRNEAEQKVQEQRNLLEQGRMQRQEVLIHHQTVDEQIQESGFACDQLLQELPEDATKEAWQEELERMDARIRRLGPINLAAIDEFQEQSERKQYLDAQHADVTESLETLENAIRKIDRETRTRFKETFDRVNVGLQEKFPRLFGGGHAYLQLTGEDLLDTGVTVMARPPGKRNTSIHLLSGGEKALTAVALVFAIFELNPAPFCMLDEVDAPLDDANVGRFCELVKSMSDRVQFIMITHNKISMEIAKHLTGVTMHEAGVSRLVSVDVEEAALMAAS
jgi:chromosome segregation protein